MGSVGRPRVLIVDDELPIGDVFKRVFLRWDVVHEPDPEKAFELLCRDDELFDVVFLDILMPHLNGIMLYEDLLDVAPARERRIVFLTGGGQIPAVADFLKKHHHIEKPFSVHEIEAVVDVFLDLDTSRGPR